MEVVSVRAKVHPAPVRPGVLWHEVVHPDDEEGSGGVVIQRETSTSHQPLMAVCRYEGPGGDAVVALAEVLLVDLTAILISTPEFQSLTLHGSFCRDTDESCEPNYNVLVVSS